MDAGELLELAAGQVSVALVQRGRGAARPRPGEMEARLLAWQAARGEVRVVDAGNCFRLYQTARHARRLGVDGLLALQRIHIARAFTCYQLLALLRGAAAQPSPLFVLDLLATFYDENVSLSERQRLLRACMAELRRLSRAAPVAASAGVRAQSAETAALLDIVAASARIWE
ncbi:MAG: hypothetical protein L0Z70_16460 [Chloroflexi bacterium]|nr:hypothetical protein [Chloroflexota bacterium]